MPSLEELVAAPMARLICRSCRKPMAGYAHEGPDAQCSDCAFPEHARAMKSAAEAVERMHFGRTGEHVSCGELLRRSLGF